VVADGETLSSLAVLEKRMNFINPLPSALLDRYQWRYDGFNAKKRNNYNPGWAKPGDPVGHKGIDLEARGYGETLVATEAGFVHKAGWLNTGAGYGEELWHPDNGLPGQPGDSGWLSRAIHMNKNGPAHDKGDEVKQGDRIGEVGKEGITSYPHVHFELRRVESLWPNVAAVSQGIPYDPVVLGIFTNTPGPRLPREDTIITKLPTLARMFPEDRLAYQDVRRVQALLAVEGFIDYGPTNFDDEAKPDGLFGPSTEQAVREFQAFLGLAATGVVDEDTWAALLGLEDY